jgi:hypothetical protein
MKPVEDDKRLEALLRSGAGGEFRPGFSGRVLARLEAEERREGEADPALTWLLFPRVALAAAALVACLAVWNLGSGTGGAWTDRLLGLPSPTLDNSLEWANLEEQG